jgi:hypothetical protein
MKEIGKLKKEETVEYALEKLEASWNVHKTT